MHFIQEEEQPLLYVSQVKSFTSNNPNEKKARLGLSLPQPSLRSIVDKINMII